MTLMVSRLSPEKDESSVYILNNINNELYSGLKSQFNKLFVFLYIYIAFLKLNSL